MEDVATFDAVPTAVADEALRTERKNQVWAFVVIGFFCAVSIGVVAINELYIYLVAYLWFGFIYGMCLQGGRFCFSSAFRDLFAVGVPRMVVGIVIACLLFGFTAAFVSAIGMSAFHPAPWGIYNVIAGVIFGVGMVFAGGCASSSLYKSGEGNFTSMLVILSISTTQAFFASVGGWFNRLAPKSWHDAAVSLGLPEVITPGDGWYDMYLAGYVWTKPKGTYAQFMGVPNESFLGAFAGNLILGVLVPGALLLAIVYYFYMRKGFLKKWKREKKPEGWKADLAGYWSMLMGSKRTAIAGLILGIACGLHMLVMTGLRERYGISNAAEILRAIGQDFGISVKNTVFDPGYWYVTTQEAQWVGWVMQKLGWNNMDNIYFGFNNGIPNPLFNPADWMSLALIGGAGVMALLHNEFKWKFPSLELAMWALIGGALMGIGSRLGLGCNVGAFFVRTANGDLSGWLFGLGMVGGAYVGVKFFVWWTERKMAQQAALAP